MKNILLLILIFILTNFIYSQDLSKHIEKRTTNNELTNIYSIFAIVFPFNPIFLVEDNEFSFGFTKEISIGFLAVKKPTILPRIGFEYSYLLRKINNNHLRTSLDLQFPVLAGDFVLITAGFGGGYFSDFKKSGIFPQLSSRFLIPINDNVSVELYIKARNTFMFKKENTNISDISFGLSTVTYIRF